MITKQTLEEIDGLNAFNHSFEIISLEKEWRKNQPKLTDKEWLEIFPEAKEVVPQKIHELEQEEGQLKKSIKDKFKNINKISDEFLRWLQTKWVEINEVNDLITIKKHISKLKGYLPVFKGRVLSERITEEQKQKALLVPIESLLKQNFRKNGTTLVGLCPLHEEKHPSFYIYLENNTFYCFGCSQGGDVINLTRLLYGFSFKEAVEYLNN
jgi:DNA primase